MSGKYLALDGCLRKLKRSSPRDSAPPEGQTQYAVRCTTDNRSSSGYVRVLGMPQTLPSGRCNSPLGPPAGLSGLPPVGVSVAVHQSGPRRLLGADSPHPAWPTFQGGAVLVGASRGMVSVYVDRALGDQAVVNATDLLADADRIVADNNAVFAIVGGPVSVLVCGLSGATDGSGGADHGGCDFMSGGAIEVCAAFGNSILVGALFEAELAECAMNGALCGSSTGEALSRWCAAEICQNAIASWATAPAWVAAGMPNWVDHTFQSDMHEPSVGCAMAFISWLRSQGFTLGTIAQRMVALGDDGTLAQLHAAVMGAPAYGTWQEFECAVAELPDGVSDDDPFFVLRSR